MLKYFQALKRRFHKNIKTNRLFVVVVVAVLFRFV